MKTGRNRKRASQGAGCLLLAAAPRTDFLESGGITVLRNLAGMVCAGQPPSCFGGPAGFIAVTGDRPWQEVEWRSEGKRVSRGGLALEWSDGEGKLRLRTEWRKLGPDGVVERRDFLLNSASKPVRLRKCLSAFVLAADRYEVCVQSSRWSEENQCEWLDAGSAAIEMASEGRTTHGGAPYCSLRRKDGTGGIAFHIVPKGNWVFRLQPDTRSHRPGPVAVEAGLSDRRLELLLKPGERISLPSIIIQGLPMGRIEAGAAVLHRAVFEEYPGRIRREVPIPYNTWFHRFDRIEPALLEPQIAAAAEIGCEVFVVDAGWYGHGHRPWYEMVGDWRENETSAFMGRMKELAARVKSVGLGFGLWIEPERISAHVVQEKRLSAGAVRTRAGQFYPDLAEPRVWRAVRDQIAGLIERYELGWVKIDHNHDLEPDPRGSELFRYSESLARLVEAIKSAYPRTVLEGCASGGLRMDINTLSLFDTHFLSDTVDPVDELRIGQGLALRAPLCRAAKWIVLAPADVTFRAYSSETSESRIVVAPRDAGWGRCQSVDADFAMLCALPGMPGFSGDIAGLTLETRRRAALFVSFVKKWRRQSATAPVSLLTPWAPLTDRSGWVAMQTHMSGGAEMLLAYRLNDPRGSMAVKPVGLDPNAAYSVSAWDGSVLSGRKIGRQLMEEGVWIELRAFGAAAVVMERCSDAWA